MGYNRCFALTAMSTTIPNTEFMLTFLHAMPQDILEWQFTSITMIYNTILAGKLMGAKPSVLQLTHILPSTQ
jgi:hypothetical protein